MPGPFTTGMAGPYAVDTLNALWTLVTGAFPNFADNEVPSGTINGSNVTFTLAHTPNPANALFLVRNGVVQKAGGVDYTLAGNTITYATAPVTGDTHECWYRY